MNYSRSSKLFAEACITIPGGVNSPVRAFKSVGGTPIFMQSAKGAYLHDVDGNSYIDYINSWGPQILGHAFSPVIDAIKSTADLGTSFGTPAEIEVKMANLLTKMVPGIDQVRMVNSGTEACMSAVRLARGVTGREKIIKFAGCYHGHADAFLIEAGSGAITFGTPNSPGVTQGTAKDTLLAQFNSIPSVLSIMDDHADNLAAIIIEPVAGNMGCIAPAPGFLESLRELCTQHGILLIFDEVMTGFRLAPGGAQDYYGITADIVCYGKIIGGGLPVGAFAASTSIMSHLAPEGPVYQAGTLSGNPLAMAAGYTMLKTLDDNPEIYTSLAATAATLESGLLEIFTSAAIPAVINRVGSMISLHFCDSPVTDFESAKAGDNPSFKKFFHNMLTEGIYLPPSAYETWFVCNDITSVEIEKTLEAVRKSIS
jgi:glutamate-1-semialdehyde 2,1-aminomutase